MISTAYITSTQFHGGISAERVMCRPQSEFAQRANDAATSG